MNKLFLVDTDHNIFCTYDELLSDLSENPFYRPYCRDKSSYQIFRSILLSLLDNKNIILLDSDFSEGEIENLLGVNAGKLNESIKVASPIPKDIEAFISIIEKMNNWSITLFTSGTTGVPKRINHSFSSVTRAVVKNDKHKDDIWGFAYNPTHIAGIQVFFQAFLNVNSIINLFGKGKREIFSLIQEQKVTNISATPTFFRMLLPAEGNYQFVRRITSGGEQFDAEIIKRMSSVFSHAEFRNIYASTEAGTLFVSNGDVFTVPEKMKNFVKIEDDELCIHKKYLAEFDDHSKLDGDWYRTGDIISVLKETPLTFKFISRKNEMINVGGYKVNPHEVESVICTIGNVKSAHVYGKPNPILGNFLYCDVELINGNMTENDIREYLKDKLQPYKIPRLINIVENTKYGRTGKKIRS